MANAHRRNFLQNLIINGRRLEKEVEIKEGLVNAFQNLLYALGCWHPSLPGLPFNVIESEEATKLKETFMEDEIRAAISGLNGIRLLVLMASLQLSGPYVGIL